MKTLGCSALAHPMLRIEVARFDYHIVIELIEFSCLQIDMITASTKYILKSQFV